MCHYTKREGAILKFFYLTCMLGGALNLYNDENFCFYFGMAIGGAKEQCINLEAFANFLGLLESIPFHDTGSSHGSDEHAMPDSRYISFI